MSRMPNIAAVLKSEIERVARKEVKSASGPLRDADKGRRTELLALRKRVAELERQVKQLARGMRPARAARAASPPQQEQDSQQDLRWRHDGFVAHRARLGVTQAEMARLIGCSALSVYKWETGQVRPRRAQLEAIAQVRKLSKAQAHARLEELQAAA